MDVNFEGSNFWGDLEANFMGSSEQVMQWNIYHAKNFFMVKGFIAQQEINSINMKNLIKDKRGEVSFNESIEVLRDLEKKEFH